MTRPRPEDEHSEPNNGVIVVALKLKWGANLGRGDDLARAHVRAKPHAGSANKLAWRHTGLSKWRESKSGKRYPVGLICPRLVDIFPGLNPHR